MILPFFLHINLYIKKALINSNTIQYTVLIRNIWSLSALNMELQLDSLKQRGAVKRVLFLDSHQHHRSLQMLLGQQDRQRCLNHTIYLRVSKSGLFSFIIASCHLVSWVWLTVSSLILSSKLYISAMDFACCKNLASFFFNSSILLFFYSFLLIFLWLNL